MSEKSINYDHEPLEGQRIIPKLKLAWVEKRAIIDEIQNQINGQAKKLDEYIIAYNHAHNDEHRLDLESKMVVSYYFIRSLYEEYLSIFDYEPSKYAPADDHRHKEIIYFDKPISEKEWFMKLKEYVNKCTGKSQKLFSEWVKELIKQRS